MENDTSPLIIIAGPTAVGKSACAVELAKAVGGSVISADSMQVYRGMDIGSAKITTEEMQGIKHYLIDILDTDQEFHVALFKELAQEAMADCKKNGRIPILTGGTGFYIQALLYDIDFTAQEKDEDFRLEMARFAEEHGALALHERLAEVDPEGAAAIPVNNTKRVIRALEFYRQSGGLKISDHNRKERAKPPAYPALFFVLSEPRERLYQKINDRVDKMIALGLVDEVKTLMEKGCKKTDIAMQGLGYKEVISFLEGEITLDEAVFIIKRDSRHFAKRQLTWFKREPQAIWVEKEKFDYDEERIFKFIFNKTSNFLSTYA